MHKIAVPKFSENIFKAYDIRGKYPEDLNEDAAYKIARSFASYLKLISKKEKLEVIVSTDDRPSSPALKQAFTEGLLQESVKVVDAGITTTPMHYFIVNKVNADGGAMITASHRPFEYNGIKLSKKDAVILGDGSGLTEIRNTALRGVFSAKDRGIAATKDFKEDYLKFFEEKFANLKNYKIKIKIDIKNSVVNIFFYELISKFPKIKIVEKNYDLAVSFDRDGDRVKFSDEKGNEIAGDIITALLVKRFKERIIFSTNSSRAVKEEIEANGGQAIESRVGHSFMKRAMRENNAVFGGELSGHYYFRDFFYCDCAIFAMFSVIDFLSTEKKALSKLVAPLQRYFATPELNFEIKDKDKEKIIDKTAAAFSDGKISYKDGIKVDYPDWWFILRGSNTEDLIRLRVESTTLKLLEEKKKLILSALGL